MALNHWEDINLVTHQSDSDGFNFILVTDQSISDFEPLGLLNSGQCVNMVTDQSNSDDFLVTNQSNSDDFEQLGLLNGGTSH